jgi:transcriptional regulator with XRE-family HTH domain
MAARSSHVHVLRTLRKRYGYSQQKLATVVGCSLATVKFIETGRLRPSADLADRVRLATGLDPQQLIGNFSPAEPRDPCGVSLTHEAIKLRQAAQPSRDDQTRKQVDGILRLHAVVEEILLDASVVKGKLWAVRAAYQTYVNKLINDFGLGKDFRRMLAARYGVRDPWSDARLYMIANGDMFETQRKAASAKRAEFYDDMQTRKNTDKSVA